jgi:hypothetical protein
LTVANPPGFLQNAGATHTAEQFRNWITIDCAGKNGATSLITRGGVNPALGSTLQVTQTGSPSMGVIVKSGHAIIPGTEGSQQGGYSVFNNADVTLSIGAAHASLNRLDSIVFKVEDAAYSGANNTSSLVVVAGTPASSPAAPTLPANSIELARVSILANDTSITNSEITDKRFYLAGAGGVIVCTSATRPASTTVVESQLIYETDTDIIYAYDGSTWNLVWKLGAWTTYTPTWTSSGTAVALGNGVLVGKYIQIGKTVHVRISLTMGSTTTFGTGFYQWLLPVTAVSDIQAGSCLIRDTGTTDRGATAYTISTTQVVAAAGTGGVVTNINPQTFANTDVIIINITLEAA